MTVKSAILEQLEANRDASLSGECLAGKLAVSRSAIWKAVNELKKEGYRINAITNKGYRLAPGTDRLSAEGIRPFLKKEYADIDIITLKRVDSTNLYAKNQVLNGAAHGTVVMSEEQTSGVGRYQRVFASPSYTGIYMSVILKPNITASDATLITTATALSVCRAVTALTDLRPGIKWVNDIILNGRKVCGISAEAVSDFVSGVVSSVVVGIGINFNTKADQFADELRGIAGSLFPDKPPPFTRNRLIAEVLNNLFDICRDLPSRGFMREYKALSCILGKDISVYRGNECYSARAVDIEENGALVVWDEAGERQSLLSGEVRIIADLNATERSEV